MKKNTSEEAYYERMRNLAQTNKSSIKESQNRGLGTLISFERAADGVAYGIIKEQHQYYIKKGGINENQNVEDFAYIGGQANITDFQYKKLSEAQKQINIVLKTINEGLSTQINKAGTKTVNKKVRLTEDKAGQEIDIASSKVPELDAATAAVPAEPETGGEGAAEMDAGIEAMDADAGTDLPDGDSGADLPDAGTDLPDAGTDLPDTDGDDDAMSEMQSNVAKIANEIKNSTLDKGELTWLLKTFVKGFVPNKDETDNPTANKMSDIDDDDRHEVSDMILNVVSPEEIEDLGQNVEDTVNTDEIAEDVEETCDECGGFAKYVESRGYNAKSIKECGEEEMTNMVSGYANAHGEGQNDGDFKTIAILITPEILEKLKSDYGHNDFADKVEPFSNEMNETSVEDRDTQINELFGNIDNAVNDITKNVNEEGIPVDSVEVQPVMEESDEIEGDDVDIDNLDVSDETSDHTVTIDEPTDDAVTIDEPTNETPPIDNTEGTTINLDEPSDTSPFSGGFQSMGAAVVKPDGAPTTITVTSENGTTVDVSMNEVMKKLRAIVSESKKPPTKSKTEKKQPISESEIKLRKYIRNKLKENAGFKKPKLNENEKSKTLKKLDNLIDKQYNLYEDAVKKKVKK